MAAVDRLLTDLRGIFAERLRSLVIYGRHAAGDAPPGTPIHTLALVGGIGIPDLEGCARAASGWQANGLAVPLVLGEREFARSLDAFPLEFGAIIDQHRVVFGNDPFEGLTVARDDRRRACEIEMKGHVLHLRESFIESRGQPSAVARLVHASAPALRALVTHIARLDGAPVDGTALSAYLITRLGEQHARTLTAVIALDGAKTAHADAARLFPDYLPAAEALATYVDGWTS